MRKCVRIKNPEAVCRPFRDLFDIALSRIVVLAAAIRMCMRCMVMPAGLIAAAAFADAVENRARGINEKAVILCDMMRDLMQMIAVKVDQLAAFRAFQMKMRMTGAGFRLSAAVLPACAAAVIERIAPYKSFLFQLFELPVDRRSTHRRAVFGQGMEQIGSGDVLFRMRFEIGKDQRFLFGLIAAPALHVLHLRFFVPFC